MDVGRLVCDHINPEWYEARHPEAQDAGASKADWLVGSGKTPEDACRDLSKKAGKKFKAAHRGPSKGPDPIPEHLGELHHEAEGDTPEGAWAALNAECAHQAPGCK
jgi:hypothetical protein